MNKMPMNIFRFTGGKSYSIDEDGGVTCIRFESEMVPRQSVIVETTDETMQSKDPKERRHRLPNPFRPLLYSRTFSLPVISRSDSCPPPSTPALAPIHSRPTHPLPPQPRWSSPAVVAESRIDAFNRQNDEFLAKSREEFLTKWITPSHNTSRLENFKMLKTLAVGSYGRVMLVKHKKTKMYYAMKILKKQNVVQSKQVQHTLDEKQILQGIKHPFIVNLKYHFKDNSNLYMVMEYVPGDLFFHLRRMRRFKESLAKFYAAQVLLALEYLHTLDIIYRDLKPENILIDKDGYLKLADFGMAKHTKDRCWTVCGTPEYMSPEIFLHKGYRKSVDWWALGILIFEMTAGRPPFHLDGGVTKMLRQIITQKLEFPSHFSVELKDLLENLLEIDITKRYGNLYKGVNEVRNHKWFSEIDWLNLIGKKIKPSLVPRLRSPEDTCYFDPVEEDKYIFRESSVPLFEKEFSSF